MTDKLGPLHRFRRLHLAQLDEKNAKLTEYEIPQPSLDLARARTNAPEDLKDFGAFYENGQLVVDGKQTIGAADLLQGPVGSEVSWEIPPDTSLTGKHVFFVRVTQAGGNHAWSSPLWIEVKP